MSLALNAAILPALMGLVIGVAAHQAWLWRTRSRDGVALWATGWCLATEVYLVGHYLQVTKEAPDQIVLGARLSWTSGLILIPVIVGLGHALSGRAARPWIWRVVLPVNAALLGLVWFSGLITTTEVLAQTDALGARALAVVPGPLPALLAPYVLLIFVYFCLNVLRGAALLDALERWLLGAAFAVYTVLAVNEILHAARVVTSVRLFEWGFVAVAGALTALLARRHSQLATHLEEEVVARTRALEALGRELEALMRAGHTVMAGLDLDQTLLRIVEETGRIARSPHVKIMLVDRESRVLRVGARSGSAAPDPIPLTEGYAGAVVATGEPLFASDTQSDPRNPFRERHRELGLRAYLGVPVGRGGEIVGVLSVNTEAPPEDSAEDIAALTALADQAAVAIHNARLYQEVQQRERRVAALASLAQSLAATLSLDEVLQRVASRTLEVFGSNVARIWLADEASGALRLRAHVGEAGVALKVTVLVRGEGLMGQVVEGGTPLLVEDIGGDPRALNAEGFRAGRITAYAGVPMRVGRRVVGGLAIAFRERRRFDEETVSVLQALADHAAAAVQSASIYERSELRGRRLGALVQVARRLTGGLDLAGVLGGIAASAAEVFEGEAGFRIVDGGDLVRVGATAGALKAMSRERIRVGESISGQVAATGRAFVTADLRAEPLLIPEHREGVEAGRTGALMCVPVAGAGDILGTLNVYRGRDHHFDDDELILAQSLADQAGVAIENARLHGATVEQAEELAALDEVRGALVSSHDLQTVLEMIADWAVKLLSAQGSSVFEWEEGDGLLHPRSHRAPGAGFPLSTVRPGQGAAGAAFSRRALYWNPDIGVELLPGYGDEIVGTDRPLSRFVSPEAFRAVMAVPIMNRGEALGAICVYWAAAHTPDAREIRLITALSQQAAVALEHAGLFADLAQRFDGLEILSRLTRLVSSSLDLPTVLQEIARSAAELTGSAAAVFWMADDERRTLTFTGLSDTALDVDFPFRTMGFDEGFAGWVATHRRPLSVPDVRTDERPAAAAWWKAHGLTSTHGVPIISDGDGRLIAVLILCGREPIRLDSAREEHLRIFTVEAALAIRQATAYEAEARARREAELALSQVKELHGLLPICAYCKKVRDDQNYWQTIERYIGERSRATFSHGICPDCRVTIVGPQLEQFKRDTELPP